MWNMMTPITKFAAATVRLKRRCGHGVDGGARASLGAPGPVYLEIPRVVLDAVEISAVVPARSPCLDALDSGMCATSASAISG